MPIFNLQPSKTALLLIDIQEKLFPLVERSSAILNALCTVVQGFQLLDLPILISEQYPRGLGTTIEPLRTLLGDSYHPWVKSTFSCVDNPSFNDYIKTLPYTQWVVAGIESHICVLQTAKGLINAGTSVVVLNDAVASRSSGDHLTSLAEMRDAGIRISTIETVLFELVKDSNHPNFKSLSKLIKARNGC